MRRIEIQIVWTRQIQAFSMTFPVIFKRRRAVFAILMALIDRVATYRHSESR